MDADHLRLNDEPAVLKVLRNNRDSPIVFSTLITLPKRAPSNSTSPKLYVLALTDQTLYIFRDSDLSLKYRLPISEIREILIPTSNAPSKTCFVVSSFGSNSITIDIAPDSLGKVEILASFPSRITIQEVTPAQPVLLDEESSEDDASRERHLIGTKRFIKEAFAENPYFAKAEDEMFTQGDGFLLANVVKTEFLTGTLRTVLERDKQKSFRELLGRFEELADQHIQSVCQDHYQSFLVAFSELRNVHSDCTSLRSQLKELNGHVQEVGGNCVSALEELQNKRYVAQNIAKAMSSVAICQRVATMGTKVEQLIKEKKYYPALKTLHKMELSLPLHISYGRYLASKIPKVRLRIKQIVLADFNDWLVQIRELSTKLGQSMLDQVKSKVAEEQKNRGYLSSHALLSHSLLTADATSDLSAKVDSRADAARANTKKRKPSTSQDESVDYAPLYTCSYVHKTLHEDETFRNYYAENRRKQIELDLAGKRTNLMEYLERIVGFFMVESRVTTSAAHLMPKGEMGAIWDDVLERLKFVVGEHLDQYAEPLEWIKQKENLVCFGLALQLLSLHVTPFFDFLESFREKFAFSVLLPYAQMEAAQVMDADKYELDSPAVRSLCDVIEGTMRTHLMYGRNFIDVDESAKRVADDLMRSIAAKYDAVLNETAFSNVLQCACVAVNCASLHAECAALESSITRILENKLTEKEESKDSKDRNRNSGNDGKESAQRDRPKVREFLTSRTSLLDVKAHAEDFVFKSIMLKCDEFILIGFNADWMRASPPSCTSDHILDLAQYLWTTFALLEAMPRLTLQALEERTCEHIATHMLDVAAGAAVRQVTRHALAQLEADFGYMETAVKKLTSGAQCAVHFAATRAALTSLLVMAETVKNDQEAKAFLSSRITNIELVRKMVLLRDKIREPPKSASKTKKH